MEKEQFNLGFISPKLGRVDAAAMTEELDDRSVILTISDLPFVAGTYIGKDAIDALRLLRRKIEPEGWRVLCNGARRNGWASGMARDMSNGFRMYSLRTGKRASINDVVDTFGTAPADEVATCDEQRAWYESWLANSEFKR